MTIGMVLWALAVGAALSVAGWGFARLVRRGGLQERWVWMGALALTAGASWLPLLPQAAPAAALGEVRMVEVSPIRATLQSVADTQLPGFGIGWVVLAGLILVGGLLLEVRHQRRRARMTGARIWGYPVLLDGRDGPAVAGVVRPTLVLPPRALELDGPRRRALVTHEIEHLRSGDLRLVALAWLAVAAAPWNPWSWTLARRVGLAVEADCDLRTLQRRATSPRAYAELLIEVARWRVARPSAALQLAMGRDARRLMARIDRLLPARERRRAAPALLVLVALASGAPALADPPRVRADRPDFADRAGPATEDGVTVGTIRARPDTLKGPPSTFTYSAREIDETERGVGAAPAGRVTATATFGPDSTGGPR